MLWHPGQLSSMNTSAMIDMLMNLEIGDDAVVGTNNGVGGSISMSMIFALHTVAVDDGIISVDKSVS